MADPAKHQRRDASVVRYKQILRRILDTRPSGTRRRLAEAIGKNPSFISQISSPAYSTPVPAQHLEYLFEICHFSAREQEEFLQAYRHAHPHRKPGASSTHAVRHVTLKVPDFGNAARNHAFDQSLEDFAARIARAIAIPPQGP